MVDPINGLSDDECNISMGYFSRLGNDKDHVQIYTKNMWSIKNCLMWRGWCQMNLKKILDSKSKM